MTNMQRHTAPETLASPARSVIAPWATEAAFVGFLLLVFVSLQPFQARDPAVLALGESGFSGAGDIWRQICYLSVFAVIFASAFERRGFAIIETVPVILLALLAWCAASAAWAAEPGVAIRRAGLEVVIVLSAMLAVDTIGVARSLRLLYWVLAAVLVVNWISVALGIPQAIHLSNEGDPSIIGDWRGLYFHKNIAGAVTAMSAMIFLYYAVERKSWRDAGLFLAAIGFLIGTHSKSSMGFLPAAILFGAVYRAAWKRGLDKLIVSIALVLVALLLGAALIADSTSITQFLADPSELTGRTAIWQAEIAFIRDHPLFGSGFGTFADTGDLSPLHGYVSGSWIEMEAHGHNAYLQLCVTTGVIGFALAMISFVLMPGLQFWRSSGQAIALKSLLFAIFAFMLLHNILESDFLEGDGPAWVVFLLMLGMMRKLDAREAAP